VLLELSMVVFKSYVGDLGWPLARPLIFRAGRAIARGPSVGGGGAIEVAPSSHVSGSSAG
jgi:hypothetical protein